MTSRLARFRPAAARVVVGSAIVKLTGLSSRCLGNKGRLTVVISKMPTGDLTFLDADYHFRVTNTSNDKS